MFWSLLLLIVMAVMVFTTRPVSGNFRSRGPGLSPSRPRQSTSFNVGPGLKIAEKKTLPNGNVSYRLMEEHLPSPGQRLWRQLMRLLGRSPRRDPSQSSDPGKPPYVASRPPQSAELQNFLEARRRGLSRKGDDGAKRGPDDTLH